MPTPLPHHHSATYEQVTSLHHLLRMNFCTVYSHGLVMHSVVITLDQWHLTMLTGNCALLSSMNFGSQIMIPFPP